MWPQTKGRIRKLIKFLSRDSIKESHWVWPWTALLPIEVAVSHTERLKCGLSKLRCAVVLNTH